ncbi:hypothetical protein Plim_3269 [Planctopirus limnophila DSM 3776]|uniref:Uncharacterized protein n=1 Tax=Planctopirus limnophila (strain ATCC 43296 / DSM 3776 / IFAM 1008 / Mu 290) TaxID=521674 RepID=D5STQ3_PLAL2|nr:hypothetical protein [Planctopirus limnophila]ADG69082.1 hypothetical protein Plim_3269 [Planctopirus limnophila DSM 3776]
MTFEHHLTHCLSRRELNALGLAALSGLLAGCSGGTAPAPAASTASGTKPGETAAETMLVAETGNNENNLLLDPHVCRGINTCKNKGKKGTTNECAGTAHCATAVAHDCNGFNECKGQGGCGEHPGENSCKGKGACAVPMTDKTWPKARKKFEELMTKAGKKFGEAPPKT